MTIMQEVPFVKGITDNINDDAIQVLEGLDATANVQGCISTEWTGTSPSGLGDCGQCKQDEVLPCRLR